MVYKLTLGDWSKDGHGIHKAFYFDCNYDVYKIRQAYKDSCKKLGIMFSINGTRDSYTGLNLSYGDDRSIWVDYDDYWISETAFDILNEAGCFKDILYGRDNFDEEGYSIEDIGDCVKLIMNFIAISMPDDFSYKLVKDCESINGYHNDELNDTFGYGLFEIE